MSPEIRVNPERARILTENVASVLKRITAVKSSSRNVHMQSKRRSS